MDGALLAAMAIVLCGGVISGVAGFGFALVTGPLLLLIYDPPTVTTLSVSLTMITSWMVLVGSWREAQVRTIRSILPGALVGLVIGVAVIQVVEPVWIKLLASVAVILFTLLLARGAQLAAVHSPYAPPVAGLLSGIMNTTTGIAGPPIAILFTGRDYNPRAFRASIITYFYIVDILAIILLWQQDVIGRDQLVVVAQLAIPASIGLITGRWLAKRVSHAAFRKVTIGLLLLTGTIGTIAALNQLLR